MTRHRRDHRDPRRGVRNITWRCLLCDAAGLTGFVGWQAHYMTDHYERPDE
jgi:hypothetical protein